MMPDIANTPLLRICRFLNFLALTTYAISSYGNEIYSYVDENGKLVISKEKANDRAKPFHLANSKGYVTPSTYRSPPAKHAILPSTQSEPLPISEKADHYTQLIESISKKIGINAHLIHAVIQIESGYNPEAVSNKGARGLMQLIPTTAARFGEHNLGEPAANIRAGARYLKRLLKLFNGDLDLALAAYNAGEGAVQKYNNTIPPYPETQAYVIRVRSLFEQRVADF